MKTNKNKMKTSKNKNTVVGLTQKIKPNIYLDELDVDNRIIPLFKTPIILKKVQLLKTNDNIKIHAQKLSIKIKPLNIKLVEYSNILSKYKIFLHSFE